MNAPPIMLAGQFAGDGIIEISPARAVEKYTAGSWAAQWLAGVDQSPTTYLNEPLSPYEQSLWVYVCLSGLGNTCGSIPLRFIRAGAEARYRERSYQAAISRSRKRSLQPVRGQRAVCVGRAAEGDAVAGPEIFERPNSYQTWPQLFSATVIWWRIRGSVAWILADMQGDRPGSIHVVDGGRVKAMMAPGDNGMPILMGYVYRDPRTGGEVPLAPAECKLWISPAFNPTDPMAALSPLAPGRLAIATEYNASLFNASMLQNGCDPSLVISFAANLTQEQRDSFVARLRARNSGPGRAKMPLVLEGDAKASSFQSTMADMQFEAMKKCTRLEICALLQTPPVVAGWVDAAGDSSAYTQNALRQYYTQAIFPTLEFFAPAIQEISARFDAAAVSYFDVEDCPVVQEMRLSRLEAAGRLRDLTYPVNAINDSLDLGLPRLDWGDVGWINAGLLPASEAMAGGVGGLPPEGPPEKTRHQGHKDPSADFAPFALDKAAADRIWRAWINSWDGLAREMGSMIRARLAYQQRRTIQAIRRLVTAGAAAGRSKSLLESPASVPPVAPASKADDQVIADILREVFGDPKDRAAFRARVEAFARRANALGIRQALIEAGMARDQVDAAARRLESNPRIVEALRHESTVISTLIDDDTRRALKASLEEGMRAGESINQLADRIQEQAFAPSRKKALNVARNTVGGALSRARHEGAVDAGMTHKIWVHSRGVAAPREGHIEAEARYRAEPCPINQPFIIHSEDGGDVELMYPRDFAAGEPGETINCHCLSIAIRIGTRNSERGTWKISERFLNWRELAEGEMHGS
ncbi:MAG: phage portal protein [Phycisphaerae bacterium]